MASVTFSRRDFIGTAAAWGAWSALPALAVPETKPVLRFGFMTDTHVGKTVASCARVRQALELFREKGVELVINGGDIADWHYPTGYAAYRQVFDEVFAGGAKPREIYAYAWHDSYAWKGRPRSETAVHAPEAFEDVRKLLKAPNAHTDIIRIKGCTFLVFPQFTGQKGFLSWQEYESRVAQACGENPGKPVFVVDHVPPRGTVYDSYNWGNPRTREILGRYPQVVDLSGHVHGSLRNDLLIWQGEFTVVNAGCLQVWNGLLAANDAPGKQSYGVLTVDVHADRLVVRRWDVRDRSEICADRPWVVPLPFAAAGAPYSPDRLRAAEPVPAFAPDDRLSVVAEGDPFVGFRLTFPECSARAMLYRLAAQHRRPDGTWGTFTWCETFSDYWMHPKDRTGCVKFLFRAGFFRSSVSYRFVVTPVSPHGVAGRPLVAEAASPATFAKETVVFESRDPATEFGYCRDDAKQTPHRPDAEGFYGPANCGRNYLKLPAGAFAGPAGTKFRLALDIRTIQPETGSTWSVRFQDPKKPFGASGRISTPGGDSGDERYLLELTKSERNDGDTYYVCFEWGATGRVRFDGVSLVRMD